jgi:uncharacterized repeat protein (TIGR03803 family)
MGGSSGYGTVFALNRDGSGFTNLHNFPSAFLSTNSEGAYPNPGLLLLGSTLYGTCSGGGRFINLPGSGGNGTIFSISTAGTGFTNLHDFSAAPDETNSEGFYPNGEMVRLGNDFYGTANDGGAFANGTVFRFSLASQPLLKILRFGTNMIVSWPTNATGFSLQSATNTGSSFMWSNISIGSGVVGSDRVVTDSVAGPRRFYRLIR